MRRHSLYLALTIALGCPAAPDPVADVETEPTEPTPTIERPNIEFVGCRHLDLKRSACHLPVGRTTTLRIWIDIRATAPLRVEIDGAEVEGIEHVASGGGLRLHVPVSAEAKALQIAGDEPQWSRSFELTIVRESRPAVMADAQEAGLGGDPTRALALLQPALAELDGVERVMALELSWKLMHMVDDPQRIARTEETAELAHSLGRTREFASAAASAILMHVERGQFAAAQRWTRRLESMTELAEAKIWANYYRGMLASGTGDLSGSIRAHTLARETARRLDKVSDFLASSEALAVVLSDLGRGDEALALARDTLALGALHAAGLSRSSADAGQCGVEPIVVGQG